MASALRGARASFSTPQQILDNFWYDTITHSEEALRYIIDSVGIDKVVFGTDWSHDMCTDWAVSWILDFDSLTLNEKEKSFGRILRASRNLTGDRHAHNRHARSPDARMFSSRSSVRRIVEWHDIVRGLTRQSAQLLDCRTVHSGDRLARHRRPGSVHRVRFLPLSR